MVRSSSLLRERGFGLIEVMIVIVITLLMSLVIFSTLGSAEGNKRTTTSVSDIDQEGNYTSFVTDLATRSVGSGFVSDYTALYGCLLFANQGGAAVLPATAAMMPPQFQQLAGMVGANWRLAPVIIVANGSPTTVSATNPRPSDALILMAGSGGEAEYPVQLASPVTAGTLPTVTLGNNVGFKPSDLVLMFQPNGKSAGLDNPPANNSCLIEEVAASPAWQITQWGQGPPYNLVLGGDFYTPGPAAIPLTGFASTAELIDLGNELTDGHPEFQAMVVSDNGDDSTLYSYDLLQLDLTQPSTTPVAVADHVYMMKALYGVNTAASCASPCPVAAWVDPSVAPWDYKTLLGSQLPGSLYQIKAVRLGLIMRTTLPEKTPPLAAGSSVTLFNGMTPAAPTYTKIFAGNELNYRYRTVEVTIPIRNNQ